MEIPLVIILSSIGILVSILFLFEKPFGATVAILGFITTIILNPAPDPNPAPNPAPENSQTPEVIYSANWQDAEHTLLAADEDSSDLSNNFFWVGVAFIFIDLCIFFCSGCILTGIGLFLMLISVFI